MLEFEDTEAAPVATNTNTPSPTALVSAVAFKDAAANAPLLPAEVIVELLTTRAEPVADSTTGIVVIVAKLICPVRGE